MAPALSVKFVCSQEKSRTSSGELCMNISLLLAWTELLWGAKPFWLVQHTLSTGSWHVSATPLGVCQHTRARARTHTHPQHHYPWHPAVCPSLLVKHPMVLPHSVPLACHFTTGSSFLCLCVPINKSLSTAMRVHIQVWSTKTSPFTLRNMAVFLCSVYLDSSLKEEILVGGRWKEHCH